MTADEIAELRRVVMVRPLAWDQPDGPDGNAWLGHGTDMCQYYIRFDIESASYWMPGEAPTSDDDDSAQEYLAIDDAKAAAQADYEQRILSALTLDSRAPAAAPDVGDQEEADRIAGHVTNNLEAMKAGGQALLAFTRIRDQAKRDAYAECSDVAGGYNGAWNSKENKPFVDAGVMALVLERDLAIAAAIEALAEKKP
ncbi:hypothetical protein CHELA1G11_11171 [Hyphomicrobiales bacterium]|nr:hypothetical protein CHELA1G11_11171 [Hyphomicrobiales bacterium]CAH1669631.1 hypothetical protein CHELA1G2_13138 [Hyphomicrobiales bacterium]